MARVMEPTHQWIDPNQPTTWNCAHQREPGHTSLYVIFNLYPSDDLHVDDDILYIGITGNVRRRFKQHSKSKPWWNQSETASLDCYDSWESACEAELSAIESYLPMHNVVGNELRRKMEAKKPRIITCYVCGHLIEAGTDEHEYAQTSSYPAHTQCDQVIVEAYEMGYTHGMPDDAPMRARALREWEARSVLVQD